MPFPGASNFVYLGPEWAVLERIAKGYHQPADCEQIRTDLAAPDLDIGKLLDQVIRHRMLTRLALVAGRAPAIAMPRHVPPFLRLVLSAYRHRLVLLRREAVRVSGALTGEGIRHAFTKGIALESSLFRGDGGRQLGDIDLMIEAADRGAVRALLAKLGFRVGNYDPLTKAITLDAQSEAMYRIYPDHLPPHCRYTNDELLPSVSVDCANSFTWTNSEWQLPVDDYLSHVSEQEVPGTNGSIPVFEPHVQFLFTILHLFREAWFERTIIEGSDVDLAKFSDVHLMWREWREVIVEGGFSRIVSHYSLERPVSWVLVHLERTLGTDAADFLGLNQQASESWLASARALGGGALTWRGSMRERLHCASRQSLLSPIFSAIMPG